MDASNDFGPDCPTSVKDMCKLFGSTAKNVVYNWSVTQSLNFRKQLTAGIRYFDLRVAPGKDSESSEQVYFTHGLLCSKVLPALREVASFLDENPREVVLLDFNHFYKMTDSSHQNLYNMILNVFGEKDMSAHQSSGKSTTIKSEEFMGTRSTSHCLLPV